MITPQRLLCIAGLLVGGNTLSAVELYNLDFQPPEVGMYSTVFGTPTIQPTVGPFTDTLAFHAMTNYEQISLPIEVAAPVYDIRFDVLTHGLANSAYGYTIFLDTPEARPIDFHGPDNEITMINLVGGEPLFGRSSLSLENRGRLSGQPFVSDYRRRTDFHHHD